MRFDSEKQFEEENGHFDDVVDSKFMMDVCMKQIVDLTQFKPQNEEEEVRWELIGLTLRMIAEKAGCLEKLSSGKDFFLNN